jgi:anti-sigma factor RsiW
MDCRKIQPLLDAYADGQVLEQAALEISQHLGACTQCRTHYECLTELTAALAVFPVPEPPRELARNTMQAYRSRIRKGGFRQWWTMMGPGLRAAACGATAFGFGLGVFLALAVQDVRSVESPGSQDVYVAFVDSGEGGVP